MNHSLKLLHASPLTTTAQATDSDGEPPALVLTNSCLDEQRPRGYGVKL